MKKIIIRFALGLAGAGLVMAGSASAIEVDVNSIATVDQLLVRMQEEMQRQMINKNYSTLLLKDQMRAQMMAERVPQNFMKDSVQPVMVEKVRDQIKLQLMKTMTVR
ncbi:MAG: hypothetical protein D3925_12470 [Candidatus Electrothrix sp. AR5]|nr:hypothetical protein [Candidatus Electrothrix sp. AR5]MCI5137160.1 hypothetical protein [Candidatus Electrothrix sp. AR1]